MNGEMHFNKIELSQGVEADASQLEEQILEIVGASVGESPAKRNLAQVSDWRNDDLKKGYSKVAIWRLLVSMSLRVHLSRDLIPPHPNFLLAVS